MDEDLMDPQPATMPQHYRPGFPLYWRDEMGRLKEAMFAWLRSRTGEEKVTEEQTALTCAYLCYYVHAPVWDSCGFPDELAALRNSARKLKTSDEICGWIHQALEIGMDPL